MEIQILKKKKGRPKKYENADDAKRAKLSQTLMSNKKQKQLKGGRINIKKAFNKLGDKIENVADKAIDYGKAVVFGREDYPPKVRDILKKTGDNYIKSITIKRKPVEAVLTGALSLFSLGKFGKRLERSFDELFHLFIEIVFENDQKILLEKNEVINIETNPQTRPNTESKIVTTSIPQLTLNEMLRNTEQYMGKRNFYGYSAKDNNCQDFIVAFFKSNNIGDVSDITFIKQDTKQLFKDLPSLRKLTNTITTIGARANVLTTGKGMIDPLTNYDMMLNHLIEHISDPKEPIDPRDYKQAKILIDAIKKEKSKMKGKGIKESNNYIVQSVIFPLNRYNLTQAKKWLKENNYKSDDVDKKETTLRFRQIDPETIESEGYTNYITKEMGESGINLIIVYKGKNKISNNNINMSNKVVHHIHHHYHHYPESESEVESEMESDEEMGIEGGRINIGKAYKGLKKGFENVSGRDFKSPEELRQDFGINALKKGANKTSNYITSKKGGLASDLITYGIPATTGAILGGVGELVGGPALGVAGTALGAKLGTEYIAPAVHKSSGAGMKKKAGRFPKGSQEAKDWGRKMKEAKEAKKYK